MSTEAREEAGDALVSEVWNAVHLLRSEGRLEGFFGPNRAQIKCALLADYLESALKSYERLSQAQKAKP